MSALTKKMYEDLDKFFAGKTIIDVDRNTFLVCNLEDTRYKLTISLVFMRDWDSIESNDYNYVSIYPKGVVFTFPCYWVSIPKELAMGYIESVISAFYDEEISKWGIGYVPTPDDGSDGTTGGCCCGTNINPVVPPCGIV